MDALSKSPRETVVCLSNIFYHAGEKWHAGAARSERHEREHERGLRGGNFGVVPAGVGNKVFSGY